MAIYWATFCIYWDTFLHILGYFLQKQMFLHFLLSKQFQNTVLAVGISGFKSGFEVDVLDFKT
jgi:hypothetical protein